MLSPSDSESVGHVGPYGTLSPSATVAVCLHLCLMALFCEVMLLLHDWAEWSFRNGTESGYCRTITWELGYLGSLNPPCDVDRLCDQNAWQIN